jgi:ABC-2 type transport system ATP-binding protein
MLSVTGVTKRYGTRVVLDDIGFTIGAGRMTGFVGANGAGKTTAMRIILGVLTADSGTVTLAGRALAEADRRRFGYMPEERGLYPKMKVREQIVYLGQLHGWTAAAAGRHTDELLDRLGLASRAQENVEALSLGNQQRAQIAAALVHQPEVLILDEPFSGLDPLAVENVQQVLKNHAGRGVPVLFSSHQLDIVERLCDDLIIISGGTIKAAGAREELRAEHSRPVWELRVEDPGWVPEWLGERGSLVAQTPELVRLEAPEPVRRELVAEAARRGPVLGWTPVQASLAEIFREVVA